MKAISFAQHGLSLDNPQSLLDIEMPVPTPGPKDLLIEVRSVLVNLMDTKVCDGTFAKAPQIFGLECAK